MNSYITSPIRRSHYILFCFLIGMLMVNNCNSDDVTGADNEHGVVEVTFGIESVSLEVGEQLELTAYLLTATGDTVHPAGLNREIEWEWWSTNSDVFTVEQDGRQGTISGHSEGEELCIVEATILEGNSNFTGRDSLITHVF